MIRLRGCGHLVAVRSRGRALPAHSGPVLRERENMKKYGDSWAGIDSRFIVQSVTGAGNSFFSPGAMRFFSSRVASSGWRVRSGGWDHVDVLVTSERNTIGDYPRRYTVRVFVFSDCGRAVRTYEDIAGFQGYATSASANRAARRVADRIAGGATFREVTGRENDSDVSILGSVNA